MVAHVIKYETSKGKVVMSIEGVFLVGSKVRSCFRIQKNVESFHFYVMPRLYDQP